MVWLYISDIFYLMNRIIRTLITFLLTVLVAGCGSEKQQATAYYCNISTIYVKMGDALKADLAVRN